MSRCSEAPRAAVRPKGPGVVAVAGMHAALVAALVALPAFAAEPKAAPKYGFGQAPTAEQVAAWDIDVRPDGKGLPPGRGTVAEGQEIYDVKCASCHGTFGESTDYMAIAGGVGSLKTDQPMRTTGSKLAHATTLWDYINRAMPFTNPKTLTPDEVYALTAYVLHLSRHPSRRRGARPRVAAEAEAAQSRRLHHRPRLHAPRRQARRDEHPLHDQLRSARSGCRRNIRTTPATRTATSPSRRATSARSKAPALHAGPGRRRRWPPPARRRGGAGETPRRRPILRRWSSRRAAPPATPWRAAWSGRDSARSPPSTPATASAEARLARQGACRRRGRLGPDPDAAAGAGQGSGCAGDGPVDPRGREVAVRPAVAGRA